MVIKDLFAFRKYTMKCLGVKGYHIHHSKVQKKKKLCVCFFGLVWFCVCVCTRGKWRKEKKTGSESVQTQVIILPHKARVYTHHTSHHIISPPRDNPDGFYVHCLPYCLPYFYNNNMFVESSFQIGVCLCF